MGKVKFLSSGKTLKVESDQAEHLTKVFGDAKNVNLIKEFSNIYSSNNFLKLIYIILIFIEKKTRFLICYVIKA